LGAESCVIGTKDFLTKIERIGFHAYHAKARLPFIQVQTALTLGWTDRPSWSTMG
jgi:hypothetical protein